MFGNFNIFKGAPVVKKPDGLSAGSEPMRSLAIKFEDDVQPVAENEVALESAVEKNSDLVEKSFASVFSKDANRDVRIISEKNGEEKKIGTHLGTGFYINGGMLYRSREMFLAEHGNDEELNEENASELIRKFCLDNVDDLSGTVDMKNVVKAVCGKNAEIFPSPEETEEIENNDEKLEKDIDDVWDKICDIAEDLGKKNNADRDSGLFSDEAKAFFNEEAQKLRSLSDEVNGRILKDGSISQYSAEVLKFFQSHLEKLTQLSEEYDKEKEKFKKPEPMETPLKNKEKGKPYEQLLNKLEKAAERAIEKVQTADAENIAPLEFFQKGIVVLRRDSLNGKDLMNFEEKCAYKSREIEAAWLKRKYENIENVSAERKVAKSALGNVIRDELKKKIEEHGFKNVEGGKVKTVDGERDFRNDSIYFMGSVVAKDFHENDDILSRIVEAKWKNEKWTLSDAERKTLDKTLDDSFKDMELVRAAYLSYQYNTAGKEISSHSAKNKKIIEKWRTAKGLPLEMNSAEKKELVDRIMAELSSHNETLDAFVSIRKKKSDAHLDGKSKKVITDSISEFIKKEFFIETAKDDIINEPKEHEIGVDVEVEKPRAAGFEIPKKQQEIFEENIIHAIHAVREIRADDLDIDFIPTEKHFAGNLKEKMESLLNRSGFVGQDSEIHDAEEYWKELAEMNEMAIEIIALEKSGKACVVHDGNTFFINKTKEIPLLELEKTVKNVVGEKYLSAFIFGIRRDYEKYAASLQENSKWNELTAGKQHELLEQGIIYYVNEILDENESVASNEAREDVYKYIFAILNK